MRGIKKAPELTVSCTSSITPGETWDEVLRSQCRQKTWIWVVKCGEICRLPPYAEHTHVEPVCRMDYTG